MATSKAGHLEYQHHAHKLTVAECAWTDGFLCFRASGRGCGLGASGVPFLGVEWIGDLPAQRSMELPTEGGSIEGDFEFNGRRMPITALDLICTGYAAKAGVVSLDLWCEVRDDESGETDIVEGKLRCRVVERGTGRWWPKQDAEPGSGPAPAA